jgi:hypothetical protein
MAWVHRQSGTEPLRVTGATLAQVPVAFDTEPASAQDRDRGVISTRRSELSEGVLWLIVTVISAARA